MEVKERKVGQRKEAQFQSPSPNRPFFLSPPPRPSSYWDEEEEEEEEELFRKVALTVSLPPFASSCPFEEQGHVNFTEHLAKYYR